MEDGRWKLQARKREEIFAPTYVGGYGLVAANLSSG